MDGLIPGFATPKQSARRLEVDSWPFTILKRGDAVSLPAGLHAKPTLWQNLVKFAKDKPLGAFGGTVAIILIILAVVAPLVATHNPELTDHRSVWEL